MDIHTNVALKLLEHIQKRGLDNYFQLEESITTADKQLDKKDILALIQNPESGTEIDKLRLFLIYYLSNQNMQRSDVEVFEKALQEAGADISAISYVKKIKAFNEGVRQALNPVPKSPAAKGSFSSLASLFATALQTTVKCLMPERKELYVTRIVDAISELKPILGVENYLYIDPLLKGRILVPKKSQKIIIFIVGSGSYLEYQNLQDYAKVNTVSPKQIIYGSTEIINAADFLKQLVELGKV